MEDKIKLSIILPIYNVEKYLQRILDQLYEQIRVDVEVIMVNDGSPDNSEKICQEYVNKCSQFRLMTQENAGVSVARNRGMDVARGEYIAFIDPDDTISNTYIRGITDALVSEQDIYIIKYQKVYPDERIEGPYNKWNPGAVDLDNLYNMCSYHLINESWDKVYRAAFLREHNIHFIPGMKVAEDACFSIDCFLATKSLEVGGDTLLLLAASHEYRTSA